MGPIPSHPVSHLTPEPPVVPLYFSSLGGIKYPRRRRRKILSSWSGEGGRIDASIAFPFKNSRTRSIQIPGDEKKKRENLNQLEENPGGWNNNNNNMWRGSRAANCGSKDIYIYIHKGDGEKEALYRACLVTTAFRDSKSVTFSSAPLNRGKRERKPFVPSVWAGCCTALVSSDLE